MKRPKRNKRAARKKRVPGRPSSFTTEWGALLCARIAGGKSLRAICADESMPSKSTVFEWLTAHAEFTDQYARAREAQADTFADEIVEIADDGTRDYTRGADGRKVIDHDHIARARLRVDARKWIAAKLKPKKYGDKVDLTHAGPGGGAILTAAVDPLEAAAIYQRVIQGEL